MGISIVIPEIDYNVRQLCKRPYPNHSNGCPNFGKRASCPPKCKRFETIITTNSSIYVIWNIFDFAKHVAKMKAKHLNWSQRQLECCLYWQGTARKNLRIEIERFKTKYPFDWMILLCPEACGINVTTTMAKLGHKLEWPPVNKTYQVAIAGIRKERK